MDRDDLIRQIESQPLSAPRFRPKDLHIDRRDGLRIVWEDGRASHYSLVFLRRNCPCATCREQRTASQPANTGRSLTILPQGIDRAVMFADARLVGNYAIQITWGDGHSTGIYDFRFLRAVCETRQQTPQAGT